MKITEQHLREQYESLATKELIELYTKTELTDLASSVLTKILKERGVSPEKLPKLSKKEAKELEVYQEDVSPSFLELVEYIKQYESVETRKLIELYRKGKLNELAASALIQVLEDRGISQETLNGLVFEEKGKKVELNMDDEFVFVYKTTRTPSTPSLKAIVWITLIYLFGQPLISFVGGCIVGFFGSVAGTPKEGIESAALQVAHVVVFLFCLIMTILLVKNYSRHFFSGSWKVNLYSRLWVGLKWSILFIVLVGDGVRDPVIRTNWLNSYLLANEIPLENITLKIVILISASLLVGSFLEELIFRGMIQQHIKQSVTPRISVLITAGIFTIVHFGNFFFIPWSLRAVLLWFLLGIFTGFAFNKYNSCISSFIPHLVFNLKHIIVVPLMLTF